MSRINVMLNLTPDEKSSVRASFHHISNGSVLFNGLKSMTAKQRVAIYFDEITEFEEFILSSINDKYRYPNRKGKEWESLNRVLTKLRATKYE